MVVVVSVVVVAVDIVVVVVVVVVTVDVDAVVLLKVGVAVLVVVVVFVVVFNVEIRCICWLRLLMWEDCGRSARLGVANGATRARRAKNAQIDGKTLFPRKPPAGARADTLAEADEKFQSLCALDLFNFVGVLFGGSKSNL